jgi:hypothetical protein
MTKLLGLTVLLGAKIKDPAGEKARELMESGRFYEQLGWILGAVAIGIVVLGVVLMIIRDLRKKKQLRENQPPPDRGADG